MAANNSSHLHLVDNNLVNLLHLSSFLALAWRMLKSGPAGAMKSKVGRNFYTDTRLLKVIQDLRN